MDCFFQRDVVAYIVFMPGICLGHFICLCGYKSEMECRTLEKLPLLNGGTKMTTPTKEQISEIGFQMEKEGWYWFNIDYENEEAALRFIITEWEKIRNSPK